MKGLVFYKLSSPYKEDITKNCKLTINEIDDNFITLKNTDIRDINYDADSGMLTLTQINGVQHVTSIDLSRYVTNFEVLWDKENGALVFKYDDKEVRIDEFISTVVEDAVANIVDDIIYRTITDDTLSGVGMDKKPLGVNPLELPGTYKAVESLEEGNIEHLFENSIPKKGERYLTHEEQNIEGYLYTYNIIKKINRELDNGWRVPTKSDWDDVLNSIELCDAKRNHESHTCNLIAGQYAGTFLKSQDYWKNNKPKQRNSDEEEPVANPLLANGVDKFGFNLLPITYNQDKITEQTYLWTLTETNNDNKIFVKQFTYNNSGVIQNGVLRDTLCSLRLVKDYTGNNFMSIETIKGKNYKAILMPSNNAEHGYRIWLGSNVAFEDTSYEPIEPLKLDDNIKHMYIINEWDGEKWLKKELQDGDSLIIKKGQKNNHKYQLIDGILVDLDKQVNNIIDDVNQSLMATIMDFSANTTLAQETIIHDFAATSQDLYEGINHIKQDLIDYEGVLKEKEENIISALTNLNTRMDNAVVMTNDQIISGVKTFTSNINLDDKTIISTTIDSGEFKILHPNSDKGVIIRTQNTSDDILPLEMLSTNGKDEYQYNFPKTSGNIPLGVKINNNTYTSDLANGVINLGNDFAKTNDVENVLNYVNEKEELVVSAFTSINSTITTTQEDIKELEKQINDVTNNVQIAHDQLHEIKSQVHENEIVTARSLTHLQKTKATKNELMSLQSYVEGNELEMTKVWKSLDADLNNAKERIKKLEQNIVDLTDIIKNMGFDSGTFDIEE